MMSADLPMFNPNQKQREGKCQAQITYRISFKNDRFWLTHGLQTGTGSSVRNTTSTLPRSSPSKAPKEKRVGIESQSKFRAASVDRMFLDPSSWQAYAAFINSTQSYAVVELMQLLCLGGLCALCRVGRFSNLFVRELRAERIRSEKSKERPFLFIDTTPFSSLWLVFCDVITNTQDAVAIAAAASRRPAHGLLFSYHCQFFLDTNRERR